MNTRTILKVLAAILGMTLMQTATMAQTGIGLQTNSITNTFETGGAVTFFTGGDVLGAQYLYCGQGLDALKGQAMTNDPTKDAPGDTNTTGSLYVALPFLTSSDHQICWNVCFHNPAYWGGDNNTTLALTNIAQIAFDIYVQPGTPLAADGSLGQIQFGLLDNENPFNTTSSQQWSVLTIPASAAGNWVHIVDTNTLQDIQNMMAAGSTAYAAAFYFNIDNYHPFPQATLPFIYTFWIDNVAAYVAPITTAPPKMSIARAYSGLNLFTGVGTTGNGAAQNLFASNANYTWVGAANPVSYSFTVTNYPVPAADSVSINMYLIPNEPSSLYEPQYTYSNAVTMGLTRTASGVTCGCAFKIAAANTFPTNIATLTNSTGLGAWTLTFTSSTNVTMSGPGGLSTNFTLPDGAGMTAQLFTNGVDIYFGASAGNNAGINDHVVISEFKVTGTAADFDDFFANDNGSLSSVWQNIALTPPCVQVVAPGNPYWAIWTEPASGYSLYVTPSLTPGSVSWTKAAQNAPFNASTNFYQLINNNDLPNGPAGYLTLRKP